MIMRMKYRAWLAQALRLALWGGVILCFGSVAHAQTLEAMRPPLAEREVEAEVEVAQTAPQSQADTSVAPSAPAAA
jgi:hypothetical protein